MSPWICRVIQHPADIVSTNMAVDEALMQLITQPVLRFYRWSEPAVTIGYFQKWTEVPAGRPFARRYTGGGLVDHTADFTYSVIVPKNHPLDARGTSSSYEDIHRAVAAGLKREGFDVEVVPVSDPEPNAACFQRAVKYDVVSVSDQRKIAGAAQRRSKTGTLHQGSIIPGGPFDWKSLAHSLQVEIAPLLGASTELSEMTEAEKSLSEELTRTRYETDEWNRQK
jgi:lipoate-protein ligase A